MDTLRTVAKKKVLVLLRASTKQQDMETQRTNIQEYCEDFGLEPIGDPSVFPGVTGVIVHQLPEFNRMLEKLKSPEIAGVVTSELSRVMRPEKYDAYAVLAIFQEFRKAIWCEADHGLEVWSDDDRKYVMDTFEESVSERNRTFRRTHKAKERLLRDWRNNVTKLPRGVEHIKDKQTYGPNTKKGYYQYTDWAYSHVIPAFERVAQGRESLLSISRSLGFGRETTLRTTLQNRWWLGYRIRDKKRKITYDKFGKKVTGKREKSDNTIEQATNLSGLINDQLKDGVPNEPLVSVQLFDTVQAILAANKDHHSHNDSHTQDFLGTDFLRCGICGSKLVLKWDRRSGQPPVYVCSSYQRNWFKATAAGEKAVSCGFKRLRAIETDIAIAKAITVYLTDIPFLVATIEKAKSCDEARERRQDLVLAERQLDAAQKTHKKEQNLYRAIPDPDSPEAEEQMATVNRAWRAVSEAKIRVGTAEAAARPFGTDDAEPIARQIVDRMTATFCRAAGIKTMAEKRKALGDVLEKIAMDNSTIATLTIRGGLRYTLGSPIHAQKNVSL